MFIGEKERVPSRLIAVRLPDEIVNERRRMARKKAKEKGYTPTEAHWFLLGWNLFITNVPGEVWTPETIIKAYPIRWQIEIYQSCNLRRTLFGSKMHFLGSSRAQLVNILDSVSYTLPPQTTTPSVFPLQPHFDHRYASCAISCEGVAPLVLGHLRASSRFASSRPRACRGLRRGLGGGPPPGARRLPPLA